MIGLALLPWCSKLWEELADVTHDNQDCFNYVAFLPLRMMLPLYTFVGMLCAEAFRSAADISELMEVGARCRPGAWAGGPARSAVLVLPQNS